MGLEQLRRIGLTEGELKVYKAILDIGECTKTGLAKQSGVAPSNVYDITNRLIEKGMISKVEKDGVAHFSAANPRHIMDFLDKKQNDVEKEKQFVEAMLPQLMFKFNQASEKTNVEVFYGWKGLKTVFDDLLYECNNGDENFVFGASIGENNEKADRFFVKYSELIEKKGMVSYIVLNEDLRDRDTRTKFFIKLKNHNIRFLFQSTPCEITIYKNKIFLTILKAKPLVIRITSKEVADSFKQYFNLMWKQAKK